MNLQNFYGSLLCCIKLIALMLIQCCAYQINHVESFSAGKNGRSGNYRNAKQGYKCVDNRHKTQCLSEKEICQKSDKNGSGKGNHGDVPDFNVVQSVKLENYCGAPTKCSNLRCSNGHITSKYVTTTNYLI